MQTNKYKVTFHGSQEQYQQLIDIHKNPFENYKRYCDQLRNLQAKMPPLPQIVDSYIETLPYLITTVSMTEMPRTCDKVSINKTIYDISAVDFNPKTNEAIVTTEYKADPHTFKIGKQVQKQFDDLLEEYSTYCKQRKNVQNFLKLFKDPDKIFNNYTEVYNWLKRLELPMGSTLSTPESTDEWSLKSVDSSVSTLSWNIDLPVTIESKTYILTLDNSEENENNDTTDK